MAVKTKIPSENVHLLFNELRKLPKKDTGYTREETVAYLRNEILAAVRKGYTLQEIRKMFREHGVTVAIAPVLAASQADSKQIHRKTQEQVDKTEVEHRPAPDHESQSVRPAN